MLLDLTKSLSFFATLLSLYPVVLNAFFLPATRWQDRLLLALSRLAISACIALVSGILFRWPSPSNPDAGQSLTATLPIRLFLWSSIALTILFTLHWYLLTNPTCDPRNCS
jgi:hypothetical protein